MYRSGTDRTIVCTRCRHTQAPCHPGMALIRRLRRAIDVARGAVGDQFEISGTVAADGCTRPCTLAYRGSGQQMFLFGDVDPAVEIDDLVARVRASTDANANANASASASTSAGPGASYGCDIDTGPGGASAAVCGQAPAAILVLERSETPLQ